MGKFVKKSYLEIRQVKARHSQVKINLCVFLGSEVSGSQEQRVKTAATATIK